MHIWALSETKIRLHRGERFILVIEQQQQKKRFIFNGYTLSLQKLKSFKEFIGL